MHNPELQLLKQRFDIMQREINEILGVVNADLHKIMEAVKQALEAFDARLDVVEAELKKQPHAPMRTDESGKEL